MQHRLGYIFNRSLLFIVAVFVLSFLSASIYAVSSAKTVGAAAATYQLETDPKAKLKAIKYYNALLKCTSFSKTTVSGDDINNGPRWWIANGSNIYIGTAIDQWGDKNGITNCAGEDDSNPGWIEDALEFFGISLSNKISALEKLGYTCSVNGDTRECKNANAKGGVDTEGSWMNIIKKQPYLNGVNLANTDDSDYKAISYYGAWTGLKDACGGKKGGNSNLVDVKVVTEKGAIISEKWGLSQSVGSLQNTSVDPLNAVSNNSDSCSRLAQATIDNADSYQSWMGKSLCAKEYPASASNNQFLTGCSVGWANQTDYTKCTATFSGSASRDVTMRNACFLGQGLPTDKDNKTAGELCYALGFRNSELASCIAGAINRDSPSYCDTTYPLPDSLNSSGQLPTDNNKAKREACKEGTSLAITSDGKVMEGPSLAGDEASEGGATSCVIEGIGWMVCPIMNAIGGVSDAMYSWIQSILTLNPLQMTDNNGNASPQYNAWQSIRDIANILLVIMFLIVIFSQLTSIGITNYGIKKLLPRIILVAIAINLSYVLMMLAIDVVNIIGQGLYDLLIQLAPDVNGLSTNPENVIGSFVTGLMAGTIAAGAVAIGAVTMGGPALALLAVPFIVVAVLGLLAAVATLFIRNALVILLVVIAPIAFAAYLLPNTQSLFDKWRKTLVNMLMLFPMAALLFGGAKFAASIIANSDQPLTILVAIFIMAAPLGMLPWLAASGGGILASVGGKLQGLARSAKSPLQRSLKPFVDNQKAGYQAGRRTGIFGRRRSDSEVAARRATGKRGIGEKLASTALLREGDTANQKDDLTLNTRQEGLTGTGRGARRAASVFGAEDSIKNRKGAIDAEYKTRNDRLRNTAGTADNAFNVRQENATQESQTIDSELKATQRQRVATTPDLNNVEMRMRAAQDSSKRFDAQLDREFKTNVANDAVLTGVVQETKDAEFGSKALDAEQDATFNLRTESDAGLVASSQMIHEAEQQSSASQATVKAAREQEAQLDSGMINLRQQQENAEAEVTGITTERATELRERTVTDTNLRNLDINRRANEQAAKEATDESLSLYGQAVSTDGSTTQLRAGGTINPEQGQAKAAAFGIDAQRSLRAENVKAAGSAIDQAGLSSQQLVDELRANETSGYTRLTPEQEEAYVRAVVATNNVDRIADANDYVVAQARTSIDPATGAPMRPTENVLALEQAFGSAIAGSSAKPKFIGGAQLDQYKAGTMGASSDELVVITAGANKLTKSSFGGMDIDEMKRMTRVLGDERKVEQLTEAQRQGLAAIVNAALIDPIANSNFGDRETAELTRLSGILTQGLTPPPSNTPPPPTPPSAPTPRDVFGPGGSAGNTP